MIKKDVYIYKNKKHKECIGIISDVYPDDIEVNKHDNSFIHVRVNGKTVSLKKDYCTIE